MDGRTRIAKSKERQTCIILYAAMSYKKLYTNMLVTICPVQSDYNINTPNNVIATENKKVLLVIFIEGKMAMPVMSFIFLCLSYHCGFVVISVLLAVYISNWGLSSSKLMSITGCHVIPRNSSYPKGDNHPSRTYNLMFIVSVKMTYKMSVLLANFLHCKNRVEHLYKFGSKLVVICFHILARISSQIFFHLDFFFFYSITDKTKVAKLGSFWKPTTSKLWILLFLAFSFTFKISCAANEKKVNLGFSNARLSKVGQHGIFEKNWLKCLKHNKKIVFKRKKRKKIRSIAYLKISDK